MQIGYLMNRDVWKK